MPDCLPPLGIEDIDRKYELLAKMGEGGMGEIYRVRHTLLDEVRVIKTIRTEFRGNKDLQDRFLREARVATQLRHRNIAAIYDFSVGDDGTACIVMEFIDGRTLLERSEGGHRHGLAEVVEIGCQTLDALDYLHGHKVVHRDISPDNIMLTTDHRGEPRVKLIDMGIAKPLDSSVIKTATSMFIGKVRYASPEQLRTGAIGLDGGSDLYSLGVVLYELLTGELAVTGSDQASMIAGHLFHPPRSFDETDPGHTIPDPVRQVLLKSLQKERADRFADATEFAAALSRALADSEAAGSEPTRLQPGTGAGAGTAASGAAGSGGNPDAATVAGPDAGAGPTRLAGEGGELRGTRDVRPTVARPGGAAPPAGPEAPTVPVGDAGLDPTRLNRQGSEAGADGAAELDPTRLGSAGDGMDPTRVRDAGSQGDPTRLRDGDGGDGLDPTRVGAPEPPDPTRLRDAGAPPTVLGAGVAAGTAAGRDQAGDGSRDGTYRSPHTFPETSTYTGPRGGLNPVLRYAASAVGAVVALWLIWVIYGVISDRGGTDKSGIGTGEEVVSTDETGDLDDLDFGTYRALVIGNDDYASLPSLETAVRDASDVARVLEDEYGFDVTLLINVDRYELVTAIAELAGLAGPEDNLLVYYAGHGNLDRRNETAYWQPIDADPFETTNWVATKYEVTTLLDDSLARRVLVIADSCYSGAIGDPGGEVVEAAPPGTEPRARVESELGRRARIVFTSGNVEPVLDSDGGKHSLFAEALLAALADPTGPVDVPTIYAQVREQVARETAEQGIQQVPDLAPIPRSGHEGGNFFFVPEVREAT